ncbi:MAG TPA: DUF2147 domain-containing protein [Janthinobacterium sp.]|nr:DUF2147 domain-containing protein [Janthinobacterium sp.]
MKKKVMMYALLLAGAGNYAGHAQAQAKPAMTEQGTWVTASGNLEVSIAPCGAALCGSVTRVISAAAMSPDAKAAPVDPARLMGLKILSDLQSQGGGVWRGKIYNRDKDKIYDCVVELQGQNELKVRGYQFLPLFGSTQIWHRVTSAQAASSGSGAGAPARN